ncbi:hypothetical protein J2S00_001921 [Caldalkalibacillus uzonensis]|uniref:Uncharacterized protein n=1 Tax=Caldalkalibacillus uzonensis TaxID=353224 RepID=A0ABU0CUD7_9BACI|nr:hypothetical protein [Caldalkalibacillus uzonensis]MDQ0339135.1 hypothetical protein [Caldalkalibacillus uzonensis]
MEQVIQALKRTDAERRIPVLRMEIDYELLNLHEAMLAEDLERMDECKRKLSELRKEMMLLEAFQTPVHKTNR